MDSNQDKEIQRLEQQETGLIKQQGWQLTQIFCTENGKEKETEMKAMDFAKKLSVQFEVALHTIEDVDIQIIEVYVK
jgi:hypothetical protein